MNKPRIITFYLPQFHPTPENDAWWGRGFTEWTNVTKAKPQFSGHYQPHLPSDLGFYDLRLAETREDQADLARQYGVHGFCYYHYWFHGTRILERIFEDVFNSGKPDFPFCLCWANESWTKTWVGGDKDILLHQTYSAEDDLNHIKYLIPIFKDPRYIRVNNKPLLVIYRTDTITERLPEMLAVWNEELNKAGIEGLHLCGVRNPPPEKFSATINFFPDFRLIPFSIQDKLKYTFGRDVLKSFKHTIVSYPKLVEHIMNSSSPDYPMYHCPVPSWDNTPRRGDTSALILKDSNPEIFEKWLDFCLQDTIKKFDGEEQLVFINAWNEWAEGTHLEPDQKWGHAYLKAVLNSLEKLDGNRAEKK